MKQKTNLLKALALILCLALTVMMFGTSSMATITEGTNTANITVSGVEAGVKVSAYQLTTVNYDYTADQPEANPYEWVPEITTWLGTHHSTYTNMDTFVAEVDTDDEAEAFYSELAAAIRGNQITLSPAKEATVSGSATYPVGDDDLTGSTTLSDCEMGTYLVLIENGYKVYTPSVVNVTPEFADGQWSLKDQAVKIKSTNPQITKTTADPTNNTRDDITFTITADVPKYVSTSIAKEYHISDDLSDGLTLNASSVKVYGQDGSAPRVELTATEDYTLTTNSATRPNAGGAVDFTIDFEYDNITSYDKVIVEYTAKLAQNNTTVMGNAGNNNTAYLDYSNNPYDSTSWQTQEVEETVYTYGAEITKVDKADNVTTLPGAEFTLSQADTPLYFVKTADGVYYLANNTDGGATTNLVVDSNGKLCLYGLDTGTYELEETKAPDGYNKATTTAEIVLTDADPDGLLDAGDGTAIYKTNFQNSQGFQLPTTGGIGTVIFAASGIVLVGLGVVLLVVSRKNKRK